MTYSPTTWVDETPTTTPVLYNIKDNLGNIIQANVQLEVASAITPGTPLNATNLNHIENGVAALDSQRIIDEASLASVVANLKIILAARPPSGGEPSGTVTSTSYIDVPYSTINLTLTQAANIIVFVFGRVVATANPETLYIQAVVDGVTQHVRTYQATVISTYYPVSYMIFSDIVAAGSRVVKLQYKTSAGYSCTLDNADMVVLVIPS